MASTCEGNTQDGKEGRLLTAGGQRRPLQGAGAGGLEDREEKTSEELGKLHGMILGGSLLSPVDARSPPFV